MGQRLPLLFEPPVIKTPFNNPFLQGAQATNA
jgi:hypothetical protein